MRNKSRKKRAKSLFPMLANLVKGTPMAKIAGWDKYNNVERPSHKAIVREVGSAVLRRKLKSP